MFSPSSLLARLAYHDRLALNTPKLWLVGGGAETCMVWTLKQAIDPQTVRSILRFFWRRTMRSFLPSSVVLRSALAMCALRSFPFLMRYPGCANFLDMM